MADKKISALTAASTPLDGTEVLPIVQSGATVKVANNDLRPKQIQSNATSGVLQVAGPAAASTRVMTTPDANFSAARIDAGQTLFGIQRFANNTDNDASIDIYGGTTGADPYMKGYDRNGATNFEFICDTGTTDRRFDYYGKVRVYNANFVVGTSGNGIDFSATSGSGTSELLADYEEGTWTPVLTANTPGDLSVTYSNQIGRYTKVGRLVSLQCIISTSAFTHTTASSFVKITGLPFTSANFAGLETSSAISAFGGITKVGYTAFGVYVPANDNALIGQASGSAVAYDFLNITDLPSGTNKILEFTLTYNAAS